MQVRRDQHDAQDFWLALLNAVRQASGATWDDLPAVTPSFNGCAMVDQVLSELAEMLDRQPPEVRDLLLRTALLDRVNGELAGLLTGRPGSEPILLDLEDANAFVVSLDPGRTWFRYHHLFADLLRLELRRTLAEQVPTLHRRAAVCLADGDPSVALGALRDVLDGAAPVTGYVTVVESELLAAWPTASWVTSGRRTRRPNGRWLSPSRTGWCCRSR